MKHLVKMGGLFLLLMTFATACGQKEENNEGEEQASSEEKGEGVEIIQFHSEHRCMTCNKIEELTRETLENQEDLPFRLVNVDDEKNEKIANEFEAAGTALFLHDKATGNKKDLTDFAFMNAGDKDKFIAELEKEIESFKKQ